MYNRLQQLVKSLLPDIWLLLQDQYIELSTSIDTNSSLFGAQERTASKGLTLQRAGSPLAMWNHDTLSANADTNLYGSHPFVLEVRPGMAMPCTMQRLAVAPE